MTTALTSKAALIYTNYKKIIMAKKQSNTGLLISAALVAGFLLFRKKDKPEPAATEPDIGKVYNFDSFVNKITKGIKSRKSQEAIRNFIKNEIKKFNDENYLFQAYTPNLTGDTIGIGIYSRSTGYLVRDYQFNITGSSYAGKFVHLPDSID